MFKKKFLVLIILFSSFVSSAAEVPISNRPTFPTNVTTQSINFQSIKNLKNSGQIDKAKQHALIYLKQNPNDMDVMLLLGLIYYQQQDYSNAQKLAVIILNKVPKYEDARVLLINTLIATKQYAAAQNQINEGLKYNPRSLQIQKAKTIILQESKKTQTSNEIRQQPNTYRSSQTGYQKILALKNSGQLEKAKSEAINHLKTNHDDVDVMLVLGIIYYQEKNYQASQNLARNILQKVPGYTDARLLMISSLMATQQMETAAQQTEEGLKYTPANAELLNVQKKITLAINADTIKKKIL